MAAVMVARQPVLDSELKTWGYELLFRSGVENAFIGSDGMAPNGDHATMSVMDSAFFSGITQLTGNCKALVNFTRHLLVGGYAEILPKEHVVVEILEDVEPDEEVIEACYKLKNSGYTIALDDFSYRPEFEPLLSLADIVKVDFMQSGMLERVEMAESLLPLNIKLLAEKVESREDYEQAKELGYTYFQGYFFSRPQVVSRGKIPQSRLAKLNLLREVNRPDIDIDTIEGIIKSDPGLIMRLLRYLNSAFFGFRHRITSIRQAIVLLGRSNLRKWATVLVLADNTDDKPAELIKQALFRAKFCEMIGASGNGTSKKPQSDDFFIVGLLSLVDALMDQPRADVLNQLALREEISTVLINGGHGSLLADSLNIAEGVESGAWELVEQLSNDHHITRDIISKAYREAISTADQFITEMA